MGRFDSRVSSRNLNVEAESNSFALADTFTFFVKAADLALTTSSGDAHKPSSERSARNTEDDAGKTPLGVSKR
jgi:hypothetical protein